MLELILSLPGHIHPVMENLDWNQPSDLTVRDGRPHPASHRPLRPSLPRRIHNRKRYPHLRDLILNLLF